VTEPELLAISLELPDRAQALVAQDVPARALGKL
jgi:hypothetical protein